MLSCCASTVIRKLQHFTGVDESCLRQFTISQPMASASASVCKVQQIDSAPKRGTFSGSQMLLHIVKAGTVSAATSFNCSLHAKCCLGCIIGMTLVHQFLLRRCMSGCWQAALVACPLSQDRCRCKCGPDAAWCAAIDACQPDDHPKCHHAASGHRA